jgi:hypothetical protein
MEITEYFPLCAKQRFVQVIKTSRKGYLLNVAIKQQEKREKISALLNNLIISSKYCLNVAYQNCPQAK